MQSNPPNGHGKFGVVGGSPAAVEGIRLALGAVGISPVAETSVPLGDERYLGLLVCIGDHCHIDTIRSVRRDQVELPLIASISQKKMCGAAMIAGATSVVMESALVQEVAEVVKAAVSGAPLMSVDLALELVDLHQALELDPAERILLDGLANDLTVSALAFRVGYSDRHTHRLLKRLYRRLNADSRSGALSEARLRGLLT